jgi:hypothetical protein
MNLLEVDRRGRRAAEILERHVLDPHVDLFPAAGEERS